MSHSSDALLKKDYSRRAVFLDRDGTINVDRNYLHKIEGFKFIPGAPEAIKTLKNAGFLVIVVSNQSGVARGYFDEDAVDKLHAHIQNELNAIGTSIDAFYYCPHHPEEGLGAYKIICKCRKGKPGMLFQAADEYGVDLKNSFMVGDKLADIEAGQRADCLPVLVMTGYGESVARMAGLEDVTKCKDLVTAAEYILSQKDRQYTESIIDH